MENLFGQSDEQSGDVQSDIVQDQEGCYFCDNTEGLEKHHILPERFNGHGKESNIVTLCHGCHWKLERLYNKDFWGSVGVDDPRATSETHLVCEQQDCHDRACVKYIVCGTVGDLVQDSVWVCGECSDDPLGMPSKSDSWSLQKDLRVVETDD